MDNKFWEFVKTNANADTAKLRLKYHQSDGMDYALAIIQIECRKKFAKKLKQTLASHPEFLFPSVLAGEQCTSDLLANYHASLIGSGGKAVDLTAGLGIDAWHISNRASEMTAVEQDQFKAACLKSNFKQIIVRNEDCRDFITACENDAYDVAFIDPARRAPDGGRVFALTDCQPDILEMMPDLCRIARRLIIKASPMLDIANMLRSLPQTTKIISLGTPTECKELVAILDFQAHGPGIENTPIEAITIFEDSAQSGISFTRAEEASAVATIKMPEVEEFLMLPYPAVMKAAPFNLLSTRFDIGKISPNTQLYASKTLPEGFPGEAFKIEEIIPYESKHIKRLKARCPKIMVTTRNFDISADALRAKLGVKDGGDKRLFAFTAASGQKYMAITDSRDAFRPL